MSKIVCNYLNLIFLQVLVEAYSCLKYYYDFNGSYEEKLNVYVSVDIGDMIQTFKTLHKIDNMLTRARGLLGLIVQAK